MKSKLYPIKGRLNDRSLSDNMNDNTKLSRLGETATVILLSFLLFYLPSVLAIVNRRNEPLEWTVMSIFMGTLYTAVFCLNYFWLVPAMLIRNDRKLLYFLSNIGIIILLCGLIPVWFETHGGLPRRHKGGCDVTFWQYIMGYFRFVLRDSIMMVLSAALAYAMRLSRERESMRRQELELDAERRQIELKSLKAQLNPHFLFNSLNNIYALIGFAPERAQQALHDLSSMLRFMIYDSASPYVPLEKELQFIKEYVELMKLRLNSGVRLECDFMPNPSPSLRISPLLFLTLVENAFKHSSPSPAGNYIAISICERDGLLECRVENTCSASKQQSGGSGDNESGVGLANVKRQLGLLYPGSHQFSIEHTDDTFTACLSISVKALTQ